MSVQYLYRYVEFSSIKQLYDAYNKELLANKRRGVALSYFRKLWQNVMMTGVTDPSSGKWYRTEIRRKTCRGFSKCDVCELLKSLARSSSSKKKSEAYLQQLQQHLQDVHDDRETLARIARFAEPGPRETQGFVTVTHTHTYYTHSP